ncbi:MAG: oligopeptide/dipeptide ABC transporter ATP-binding protein [Candidatus Omnitrophota bacterium]
MAVLRIENIAKAYKIERGFSSKARLIKAVDGVTLSVDKGKTLGLVGESGCGKSTLAKLILKLLRPDSGNIFFEADDLTKLKEKDFRAYRQKIQIVFQDPYSSLSPRLKVYNIIAEPLQAFKAKKEDIKKRVNELIVQVGLDPSHLERFPQQLSGGERQRIGIARALATSPQLIVLDEPVSSLDLSTQAQVLNLLTSLQDKYNLSYLFIAHNLSVVRYLSDTVAVMYLGSIVEKAESEKLYDNPIHPYTKLLLSSMPALKKKNKKKNKSAYLNDLTVLKSEKGCLFYERCPQRGLECMSTRPQLREISPGHWVNCFYPEKS